MGTSCKRRYFPYIFCGQTNHKNKKSWAVTKADTRKDILFKKTFFMFETWHQTKSFTSGFKCFKSDKGHNISIYLDRILGPSTNAAGRKEKSIYINY